MIVRDQIGNSVQLSNTPQRIVSLVPSQSQLIADLGLFDKLVGVTRFCTHPFALRQEKSVVGGTKDPDLEQILALKPDLIIGNKEENRKEDIEFLQSKIPTYTSDVNTLEDALQMILDLGKLCDRQEESADLVTQISKGFEGVKNVAKGNAVYYIWKDPDMVVGSNNFIHSMIQHMGLTNLYGEAQERYLTVNDEQIKAVNPNFILLSSEPYPFKIKNKQEFESRFPNTKVVLVDGRMFSWYGSCLTDTPEYLRSLYNNLA